MNCRDGGNRGELKKKREVEKLTLQLNSEGDVHLVEAKAQALSARASSKVQKAFDRVGASEEPHLRPEEESEGGSHTQLGEEEASTNSEGNEDGGRGQEGAEYSALFLSETQVKIRRAKLAKKTIQLIDAAIGELEACRYLERARRQNENAGEGNGNLITERESALSEARRLKEALRRMKAALGTALGRAIAAETADNIEAGLAYRDWNMIHDVSKFYGNLSDKAFKACPHKTFMDRDGDRVRVIQDPKLMKEAWADAYEARFQPKSTDPQAATGPDRAYFDKYFAPLDKEQQADFSRALRPVTFREIKK